ncbi:MAG TPA: RDD family protein [Sphingobacteriaceae bacterium]
MAAEYLVVIEGRPEGPFTLRQLKEMRISADTFVKTAGMNDYKEAHEVPELRALLGFRKLSVQPQYFATLDQRLLAVVIDYFIIIGVHALFVSVIITYSEDQQSRIMTAITALLLTPFTKIIYSSVMEGSPRQATFGKSMLGLKVCDENGNRLSVNRAFVRNLAKLVSKLTAGVGYLSGFFDKRQQCLHDKIAKTLVIRERLL